MNSRYETNDLLVFSNLRWNFLYHRPQHLMRRFAAHRRVFFFEEPILGMTETPRLHIRETPEDVIVVIPYLPNHIEASQVQSALTQLLDELIYEEEITDFTAWYYSPEALTFSRHLEPSSVIFDGGLGDTYRNELKKELLERTHLVIHSTPSLLELHPNAHFVPCALDQVHFKQARQKLIEPDDQVHIPHPRIGFYGIIDEKFDFSLLDKMANERPEYQFVILGPVVKVDPRNLPRKNNIHYLGKKDYYTLPLYLAGWDATILPLIPDSADPNMSVEVLEFLAAGKRVVTSCAQVDRDHLVDTAGSAEDFIQKTDLVLKGKATEAWLNKVDHYLKNISWDKTFELILELELLAAQEREKSSSMRIIHPIQLNAMPLLSN